MKNLRALLILVVALSGSALAGSYTVKAGDTLYSIARTHNIDPAELMELNDLDSSTIQVGQTLKVPDTAPAPAVKSTTAAPAGKDGVVRTASLRFMGIPYRLGANGNGALDCSSFTQAVMAQLGIRLPRTSREQFNTGSPVARGNLQAGDLVFFNTLGNGVSHVGIYLGNGQFAHANSYVGRTVIEDLNDVYYRYRYIGARRVLPTG